MRREEKLEYPEKKSSEQGQELTANSTHMTPSLGIEPRPHWWEACAVTTALSLLPVEELFYYICMLSIAVPSMNSQVQASCVIPLFFCCLIR